MVTDYYKILNIPRNASQEVIHKAYRSKAKIYHPDVNQREGAKNNFLIVSEAYQTLINPDKKKWYDFKLNYPTSTGLTKGHKGYRHQEHYGAERYSTFYNSNIKSQNVNQQGMEETKYTKTIVDKVLFYSLVATGVFAIIFSVSRLDFGKLDDSSDFGGIIFGISFLLLLFYGWHKMSK